MGPNGAGKTTCFNVLTGRFKPDRGRVVFDGEDITGLSPNAIARRGISRSFQIMSLFDEYSALENIVIALPDVRARGFNMVDRLSADSEAASRAAAVLARVGLAGREQRRAGDLAYGERRALEIGVALAARPRILFLDEPTSGPWHRGDGAPRGPRPGSEARPLDRGDRARHAVPVRAGRHDLGHSLGPGRCRAAPPMNVA